MISATEKAQKIIAELKDQTMSDYVATRGVAKKDTVTSLYEHYENMILKFLVDIRGCKTHKYNKIQKSTKNDGMFPSIINISHDKFVILMHTIMSTIEHHGQIMYYIDKDEENYTTYNVMELGYYPGGWDYFNIGNRKVIPILSNYEKITSMVPYIKNNKKIHTIPMVNLSAAERLADEVGRVGTMIQKFAVTTEKKIIHFMGLNFGPPPDIELVMQLAVRIMLDIKSNGQIKYQIYMDSEHPVMEITYYEDGYGLYC